MENNLMLAPFKCELFKSKVNFVLYQNLEWRPPRRRKITCPSVQNQRHLKDNRGNHPPSNQ